MKGVPSYHFGEYEDRETRFIAQGNGIRVTVDGEIYQGYWKDDILEGKSRTIKINGDYIEGNRTKEGWEGNCTFCYNDGSFACKDFTNGVKNGKSEHYDNVGTLVSVQNYINGKKHGKFTYYDEIGKKEVIKKGEDELK